MTTDPKKLLDHMVEKPEIYFGYREGYLRELSAFDLGYGICSGVDQMTMGYKKSILPADLVSYICDRIPIGSGGSPSWNGRIEDATENESDAWNLFVELYSQYV